MDERERKRQRRYREAMRNRIIAAVFLAVLIVGIIFIVKGCRDKKQAQEEQQQQAAEALARQDVPQEPETHLGKFAELRRQYIKKHRRVLYTNLKTSGQLAAHLAEIETAAEKMVTRLVTQMAQNEGVTEELKAADPQRWTGLMNNLKHSAEETVLNDLIYS